MPSFLIETVLSVLGPRYELAPSSEVDAMAQKVLGKPKPESYTLKAIIAHILLHHPGLENYHQNGRRIYTNDFKENARKMIKHYRKEFGKEIEIPVLRDIMTHFFESTARLNKFVANNLREQDVISVQTHVQPGQPIPSTPIILFYWETP